MSTISLKLPFTPRSCNTGGYKYKAIGDELFKGVSAEHIHNMAMRLGAPRFMLHDLRKLVATVGETLGLGDTALRRILNHTAPKSDVLHRHYVSLDVVDGGEPLERIQTALLTLLTDSRQTA